MRRLLDAAAGLVLGYLFLPILVIVAYSFNSPAGKFNFVWKGFSLDAWRDPFRYPALVDAMRISIVVATVSTLVATVLGTMLALALSRYRFRGAGGVGLLLVLPLATPEVVLGSSLLSLFLAGNVPTGFATIVIAHVMFSVSYVAFTVRARLRGFDWSLEEAAMDLGATPWVTFLTVTLPLIAPAVGSGWLLAFTLSLDDLILTQFVAGAQSQTLPMRVYSSVRLGVDPQINVLATIIVVIAASALIFSGWLTRRRA